jgi:hypothetical protein
MMDWFFTMAKRRRIPIDELLNYWIDISKRPTLTTADWDVFRKRIDATMEYFQKTYSQRFLGTNKFFARVQIIGLLTFPRETPGELSRAEYSTMKDFAKNFIRHIKECFAKDIVDAIKAKTPMQDAETILSTSPKVTYMWAAGIIISNHLATMLIKLSPFKCRDDDIMQLYTNLKNRTTNQKLQNFLTRSYRRFEDARKLRSRCAHVLEGDPTKQEVQQSIQLARLLQKHMATP